MRLLEHETLQRIGVQLLIADDRPRRLFFSIASFFLVSASLSLDDFSIVKTVLMLVVNQEKHLKMSRNELAK